MDRTGHRHPYVGEGMVGGRPHKADGHVGSLCAGWAACSRRWDNQFTKTERATDHA